MNNQTNNEIERLQNNILNELGDALIKGCTDFIINQGKDPNEYKISTEQVNEMLEMLNRQISDSIERAKNNIMPNNTANAKWALEEGSLFGKTNEEAFSCMVYDILKIKTDLEENECLLAGLLSIINEGNADSETSA